MVSVPSCVILFIFARRLHCCESNCVYSYQRDIIKVKQVVFLHHAPGAK